MKQRTDPNHIRAVIVTDCGSTTTKALFFQKTAEGWITAARGEAPTTVERPLADVTIGARNAFLELEELADRVMLDPSAPEESPPFLVSNEPDKGIDLYLSTSSAGGGLQMIVLGVVGSMTTESAERAALGAGAIVMDSVALDDGREQHEHVDRIRHLRPDICLIAGGTDGGTREHPLQLAETLLQADPRPRFGETLRLPVIYAANRDAKDDAARILETRFEMTAVENIRPSLERENLAPARDAIHEIFLHHVMSHAPGYRKLLSWSPIPIMPTPAAVGKIVQEVAIQQQQSILAVDIGGATTDVFSAIINGEKECIFNRTVSANLGMSYSIGNVLVEAGPENIARWLPFAISLDELANRIRNKMIRPTSIPQTREDLLLEQAVCREALRLSLAHHRRLASGLKGTKSKRSIGDLFKQGGDESGTLSMRQIDLIIGSGGVLSHAPNRMMAALMMIDSFQPEGVTSLAVDSIFMMPHLGVLSTIHAEAATKLFYRDCLIPLGICIAPVGAFGDGEKIAEVTINGVSSALSSGEFRSLPHTAGEIELVVTPLQRGVDVGAGFGVPLRKNMRVGDGAIIFDGRNRPIASHQKGEIQMKKTQAIYRELKISEDA